MLETMKPAPELQVDPQILEEKFLHDEHLLLITRIKLIIRVGTPFYLLFWFLDRMFAPESEYYFLMIRIAASLIFVAPSRRKRGE